jgi:hypothetical protein
LLSALVALQPSTRDADALEIALVVDVSHSATHPGFFKRDHALVPDAITAAANALLPSDRLRIGTFGTAIVFAPDALSASDAIARPPQIPELGGPSPIWDALDAAVTALQRTSARGAIVVITDGRSTGNRLGFADVVARLQQTRLPVLVVALDFDRPSPPDPTFNLRRLAEDTRGSFALVKRGAMPGAVRRAIDAFRRSAKREADVADGLRAGRGQPGAQDVHTGR